MCICSVCHVVGVFFGDVLYAIQKVCQCLAVGSVFTCLMFSFTLILMLGLGLGYNHCFVELKGKKDKVKGFRTGDSDEADETSSDDTFSEILDHEKPMSSSDIPTLSEEPTTLLSDPVWEEGTKQRREINSANIPNKMEDLPLLPTMIVPLRSKNNILKLIDKIRKRGLNVTLELIST